MSDRPLTDRRAIHLALHIAIDTEESLIDAWGGSNARSDEPSVIGARRNIEAFTRVLNRHFGGKRKDPFAGAKRVSVFDMLKEPKP